MAVIFLGGAGSVPVSGADGREGGTAVQESTYQALEVFNGALMLIRDQYLEPVDPAFLMDGAVRGIFEALDADSAYLSADELARYRSRGSLTASVGLGLQKRYYLHVDDVLPGSPAAAEVLARTLVSNVTPRKCGNIHEAIQGSEHHRSRRATPVIGRCGFTGLASRLAP